jgi:RNA 2',3'-cyclic 3'-phosphodiesterase
VESVGRIFVATGFPPGVRSAIAERLRQVDVPGRGVDPADWHVTLRFLGEIDTVAFERLLAALDELPAHDPFVVRLTSLGAFPQPRKASVVWIGIEEGSEALGELQEMAEDAADMAGLGREERPFHPHVTLARVRPPTDVRRLLEWTPPFDIRSPVSEIVILRSHTRATGPKYEVMERFALGR